LETKDQGLSIRAEGEAAQILQKKRDP